MQRILGLDIGTTSIGFAVIDLDEDRDFGRIVDMGVRIFPEGVTEKDKEPRNKARRTARLVRRQIRRRRWRRRELGATLTEAGLLPAFGTEAWHTTMAREPYGLRASATGAALPLHEVGRALYHLVKRRGFASARLAEADGDKKDKTDAKEEEGVKEEIEGLRGRMAGATLGSFLAAQDKRRGRYLGRDMIEHEFDAIWSAQQAHHPVLRDGELRAKVRHIMFHQRPTFWRLATLGECALEPGKALCPKGSWLGQRYVMLQALNSLRLAGGNARPLLPDERAKVLELLEGQASATFGKLRKLLKLPRDQKFNFEIGGEKTMPGNALEAKLAEVFGEGWPALPSRDRIRAEIADRLREIDYRRIGNKRVVIRSAADSEEQRRAFAAAARTDYAIGEATAQALSNLSLPQGWLRHSTVAVEKLVALMEQGKRYDEAIDAAYPGWRTPIGDAVDRLPSKPSEMPDTRNPTVARALTELRRVVNNLLAVHAKSGRPDLIRIELARDLKLTGKRKDDADKINKERRTAREKAKTHLIECGIANPSRDDIEKYQLWQECKESCPYTNRKIGFDQLFRTGEFDIEHIFPLSRSLDNSYANKTLCEKQFNIAKGNRTPHEYFRNREDEWKAFKLRVENSGLPNNKIQRLLKDSFVSVESEDFAQRQLADTAYIARVARDFLRRLFPQGPGMAERVESCNGRITAQLRDRWGLNHLLNPGEGRKTRDDHRHHAVDALTVALTSRAFVKRLADHHARGGAARADSFPPAWPSLFLDAKAKLEGIVVSHRVRRKIAGPLHAQTAYGDTGADVKDKAGTIYRLFVTRKNLVGITASQIRDIRDDHIRKLVQAHVAARGGDPKKAFPPFPKLTNKDGSGEREIRKVRILVKQQKDLMVKLRPNGEAFADAGDNHHMAIFQADDGDVHFEIVSRFEAARRVAAHEPVVRQTSEAGGKFVMSLCLGDTLEFPNPDGEPFYRIISSLWSGGQIVLCDHTDASKGGVWKRPAPSSIIEMKARKVSIDPIGRVRPAHD